MGCSHYCNDVMNPWTFGTRDTSIPKSGYVYEGNADFAVNDSKAGSIQWPIRTRSDIFVTGSIVSTGSVYAPSIRYVSNIDKTRYDTSKLQARCTF